MSDSQASANGPRPTRPGFNQGQPVRRVPSGLEDVRMLEKDTKINTLEQEEKRARKVARRYYVLSLILVFFIVGIAGGALYLIDRTQSQAIEVIESNRKTLIQGLYTAIRSIEDAVTPREKRFEIYFKNGKRAILEHKSKTDLTDGDINALLKINWELSEQYLMSPYLFLAFAAKESDFHKGVKSKYSNASGIVQFMPSTMRIVLGDHYTPGIEFDPVWSCKAWYRYISSLSQSVGNDVVWLACAYMSPQAISFKNSGKTPNQFMTWISEVTEGNHVSYPFKILEYYEKYSNM